MQLTLNNLNDFIKQRMEVKYYMPISTGLSRF